MDTTLIMFLIVILLPHCHGTSASSLHLPAQQQDDSQGTKHILSQDIPTAALLTRQQEDGTRPRTRHRRHAQYSHAARALLPDMTNFASNTFGGFFGNSNGNNAAPAASQSNTFVPQDSRQRLVSPSNTPQDLQSPLPQQQGGDSRALMGGHPNGTPQDPRSSTLPTPPLNASKSLPSSAAASSSPKSQAAAIDHHPAASNGTTVSASSSANASSTSGQPAPSNAMQRFASYYRSTNRLQALVILFTFGVVMGVLVGLMAVLKCVAHKKRFANKKDYPTGFPWVEPGAARGETKRRSLGESLVSDEPASCMSTRNSMAESVHFSSGPRLHPDRDSAAHPVEYQLSDLGPDAYGDYTWALSSSHLEKDPPSPDDPSRGPSSASTDDHARTPSSQGHEQWLVQPVHGGSYFVPTGKAKILDDSKVFTLGHDP